FEIGSAQRIGVDAEPAQRPAKLRLALDDGDAAVEPRRQPPVLRRPDQRPQAAGTAADDDRRQHRLRFHQVSTSWNTRATRSTTCSSTACDVGRLMPVADNSRLLGQVRAYLP